MLQCGVEPIDRALGGVEPGLPIVLAGDAGSGRTVLSLQLTAAAIARGERVTYLTAEPPELILRQALSLGIDLEPALLDESLALLEIDPRGGQALLGNGPQALLEALRAECPDTRWWIFDPITTFTRDILDEHPLRETLRSVIENLTQSDAHVVVSADADSLEENPLVERVLQNLCGAYLALSRDEEGIHLLRVEKSRSGVSGTGSVHFRITPEGCEMTQKAVAGSRRPAGSRAKVLVVHEDPDALESIGEWVAERWDVVTAEDGVSALTRVIAEKPDLIILSLHMKRIPGREMLLSLRNGGLHTPVMALLEENGRATDRVGALVLGATEVVQQPLRRFEVQHRIEALLRQPQLEHNEEEIDGALLSPLRARRNRSLASEAFGERHERALRFGEDCGIESCLLLVETPGEQDFDVLVSAADDILRAEDAILALSERLGLILLVATEVDSARFAFGRIAERYRALRGSEAGGLSWVAASAHDVQLEASEHAWKPLRQKLVPWSSPESA